MPTSSVGIIDLMDSVLHDITGNVWGDVFSMDGKRRILIVNFFNCTQISSKKKHRKAGRIQEAFLMVFCLEA